VGAWNIPSLTPQARYPSSLVMRHVLVGLHGSGTVNQNSTKFLDIVRSHGLRVAVSWFQGPQAHGWTWYSNTGGGARDIDHVLGDGHWRMMQNCRVCRSAQFLNTDHRLVEATLKLQLKSGRIVPSQLRLNAEAQGCEEEDERGFGGSGCFGES